jgi:hypothetical protein
MDKDKDWKDVMEARNLNQLDLAIKACVGRGWASESLVLGFIDVMNYKVVLGLNIDIRDFWRGNTSTWHPSWKEKTMEWLELADCFLLDGNND